MREVVDLWGGVWWTVCLRRPPDPRIQGLPPHYLLVAVLEYLGFKFAADKCINSKFFHPFLIKSPVCRFIQELTGGVNEPHQ